MDDGGAPAQAGPFAPPGGAPPVYVVSDAGKKLAIRAVAVRRESDRAVYLEEEIVLPCAAYAKRLLIKGIDAIARNERDALLAYQAGLERRRKELLQETEETERRFAEADRWLRRITLGKARATGTT